MKIETKYNSGDEVWFMFKNKPTRCVVSNFFVDCSYQGGSDPNWGGKTYPIIITYSFTPSGQDRLVTVNECDAFSTKEELLKSL